MAEQIDLRIANMDESIALPRKNGELVFDAPWEARAFGLAVALNEQGVYPWSAFSQALAQEIAGAEATDHPSTYYERWLTTLEGTALANGLVTRVELDAAIAEQIRHDVHEHSHDHDHDHDHAHHHHHLHNSHPHDNHRHGHHDHHPDAH